MTTPKYRIEARATALASLRHELAQLRQAEKNEHFYATLDNEYRRGRILAAQTVHPVLKRLADELEVEIKAIEETPL